MALSPRKIATDTVRRLAERRDDFAYARRRRGGSASWAARGLAYAESWRRPAAAASGRGGTNPMRALLDARAEGPGLWKWDHYFDVYHRHLERFRGAEVHVLEIGIYSGGSLDLWREYLGARCHVYGVDISEESLRYESESTSIFIGDQADREFWRRFRAEVPRLDIVVDDGGHQPDQQATSLEELLPHLAPGGVYAVEDVHGVGNRFAAYTSGLVEDLNTYRGKSDYRDPDRRKASGPTGFQSAIDSIHSYPFLTVIEKRSEPVLEFVAPKRGTEWEAFLG